jgi:hypothetical protein
MKAFIEIRAPGAAPIQRELGTDTWVIGRKPREGASSIALPTATDLADENLIVSLVRDRFHVALASGARVEPSLDGKLFKQAEILFGQEIRLGQTAIRFLGEVKSNAPSPIIVVAAVVVLGLSIWTIFDNSAGVDLKASLPAAPALLDAPPTCPYNGASALGRAGEAEQAALAHGERYVFDPYDGIQAIMAYRLAAACYGNAGDAASTARASASAQHWQNRLEARYQGHQLRLRLALDRGRNDQALSEVHSLKKMLHGKTGAYVNWLTMAERGLGH